jgi:predicted Rossmann-fold nucleotide-binding protein
MCSEYWQGLIDWMKGKMLKGYGFIAEKNLHVFSVVDEPAAAVKIITDFRDAQGQAGLQLPGGMKKA